MSTPHSVLENDSLLSKIDRLLFKLDKCFAVLAGLIILAIVLISVVNIFGRKLFNYPVPGFIDLMTQAVPLIAFFGLVYCQRIGSHIRMDMIVSKLKRRSLWLFEITSTILMLAITIILMLGSFDHAKRALVFGDSTIDINLPTWPVKMIVPVMFALLTLRLLLQLASYCQAFIRNNDNPVAVPLIEDIATIASKEAKSIAD